jgi:hypothetical protein
VNVAVLAICVFLRRCECWHDYGLHTCTDADTDRIFAQIRLQYLLRTIQLLKKNAKKNRENLFGIRMNITFTPSILHIPGNGKG